MLCAIQRFMQPLDERHEQMAQLLSRLRPVALLVVALHRDARHARILMADRPRTADADFWSRGLVHAQYWCQAAHTGAQLCSVLRTLALVAHAAAPEAARAHPLLLRLLDGAIVGCELLGILMHLRIELVGARGLLTLLSWADHLGPRLIRRVRPHESGLWSRRYCEMEITELNPQQQQLVFQRRGLRWDEALSELRVPLRALYAFWGGKGLRARGYPPWAIRDIRAIDLLAAVTLTDGDLADAPPSSATGPRAVEVMQNLRARDADL